ncbi:MAG: M67 family metallopeptidase [Nitrososphaeria archaeon]
MIIKIPKNVLNEMINYIYINKPNEAVCFLLGFINNDVYNVKELVKAKNAANSPAEFNVEPDELLNIYKRAEEKGLDIVAIVHSHHGLPVPSTTDIKYMKLNPYVWIIISMTDLKMQAFILKEEKVDPVKIMIVD